MKNCKCTYTLLIGKCVVVFDYRRVRVVISENATVADLDRIHGSELYCDFMRLMTDDFCFVHGIDYPSLVTL